VCQLAHGRSDGVRHRSMEQLGQLCVCVLCVVCQLAHGRSDGVRHRSMEQLGRLCVCICVWCVSLLMDAPTVLDIVVWSN